VATKQTSPSQEGIIVQEIDVKKGDTLYDISRKFSGHGMYFPQILLFNSLQNPNLIYPGHKLKVPITEHASTDEGSESKPSGRPDKAKAAGDKKSHPKKRYVTAAPLANATPPAPLQSGEISLSELRAPGTANSSKIIHRKKTALPARNKTAPESSTVTKLSAPLPASYTRTLAPQPQYPIADAISGQKLFEAAVKAYRVDDCRTALELLDRYLADNSGSPLAADANLYKAECYLKLSAQ
jgi:LysM repeat protein